MDKAKSCSVGGVCGTTLLGIFCPLCIPAVAALISSLGLGFLITKEAVWSALALFSLLVFLGLLWGYKKHKNILPVVIGVLGIIAIPIGRYVIGVLLVTYLGIVAVIAATIWNFRLRK